MSDWKKPNYGVPKSWGDQQDEASQEKLKSMSEANGGFKGSVLLALVFGAITVVALAAVVLFLIR